MEKAEIIEYMQLLITGGAGVVGWFMRTTITNFIKSVKDLTDKMEALNATVIKTTSNQAGHERRITRLEDQVDKIREKNN